MHAILIVRLFPSFCVPSLVIEILDLVLSKCRGRGERGRRLA